jgi:hypothetical protein
VAALSLAATADAVVYVGGLQANMEEEGTDRVNDMGHPGALPKLSDIRHQIDTCSIGHATARSTR